MLPPWGACQHYAKHESQNVNVKITAKHERLNKKVGYLKYTEWEDVSKNRVQQLAFEFHKM